MADAAIAPRRKYSIRLGDRLISEFQLMSGPGEESFPGIFSFSYGFY